MEEKTSEKVRVYSDRVYQEETEKARRLKAYQEGYREGVQEGIQIGRKEAKKDLMVHFTKILEII